MEKLVFEPLDTLFFRDGQPFNRGEGNSGLVSLFPPSPVTMVGAARAAWARHQGWNGKGKWKSSIEANLGGNGKELAGLQFSGPLLEIEGELVVPAPASLIGVNGDAEPPNHLALLTPGNPMHCDLGDNVRLPCPALPPDDKIEGRKPLKDWWLTKAGLSQVLTGGTPDRSAFIHRSRLWVDEPKVGNQINETSGTVEEGMLYSTQHVRLCAETTLAMYLSIEGSSLGHFPAMTRIPLGGEARSCWLSSQAAELDLPAAMPTVNKGKIQYTVFILTPLAASAPPRPGKPFEALPGVVVSACVRPSQRWGGWDSIKLEPLPMTSHLAPGSVLFMEADEKEKNSIEGLVGQTIGQRKSWGFGLITIGHWT